MGHVKSKRREILGRPVVFGAFDIPLETRVKIKKILAHRLAKMAAPVFIIFV